jgi:hypothetical protein
MNPLKITRVAGQDDAYHVERREDGTVLGYVVRETPREWSATTSGGDRLGTFRTRADAAAALDIPQDADTVDEEELELADLPDPAQYAELSAVETAMGLRGDERSTVELDEEHRPCPATRRAGVGGGYTLRCNLDAGHLCRDRHKDSSMGWWYGQDPATSVPTDGELDTLRRDLQGTRPPADVDPVAEVDPYSYEHPAGTGPHLVKRRADGVTLGWVVETVWDEWTATPAGCGTELPDTYPTRSAAARALDEDDQRGEEAAAVYAANPTFWMAELSSVEQDAMYGAGWNEPPVSLAAR